MHENCNIIEIYKLSHYTSMVCFHCKNEHIMYLSMSNMRTFILYMNIFLYKKLHLYKNIVISTFLKILWIHTLFLQLILIAKVT